MVFITESSGYEKTELFDLQGSWESLRNVVVEHYEFPDSDKLVPTVRICIKINLRFNYD